MNPTPRPHPDDGTVHAPRLAKFYLLALGLILLLLLVGQALVQHAIQTQAGDGRVINLAGRQRMLSQRIAKAALVLNRPAEAVHRGHTLAELRESVASWAVNHQLLQAGDAAADLRPNNSPAIRARYATIQPHHDAMLAAARRLAEMCSETDTSLPAGTGALVDAILREESVFLGGMDEIVRHYELENQGRLARLRRWEIALALIMLLTLVSEAAFIFRPAIRQIVQAGKLRYRELFENAVEGIFESTPAGRFLSVNPALAHMLGYRSPAEMMQCVTSIDTDIYAQPGRRAELLALLRERDSVQGFESEVKCRDGTTRWVSKSIRAVRDEAGENTRLQGFVVDITERRRAEQEWLRASKLESLGILAGGIAHDFNNLLTCIMGNLSLARLDAAGVPKIDMSLREAESAALRARDLAQQLQTFAKGGAPIRSALRLEAVVREVTEFSLRGSNARCEFVLPDDLWPVNADRGQLGRVVQNLVINAMQAMPDGGVITVRASNEMVGSPQAHLPLRVGEHVRFSIQDTGGGIPPEHLAKIFDPYFTTKRQGSGLGLAAVYSIVRKHQGAVEVESHVGAGTTFHVWLPALRRAEPAQPEPASAEASSPNLSQCRILLMDDEAAIRNSAGQLLRHLGAEVELAASGEEAVQRFLARRAAGNPCDVVVLDLTVPGGMGGLEALEKMRAHDPAVRAVVSSGYSKDPVMADYARHGFHGCVAKPYAIAELARVLRRVMERA